MNELLGGGTWVDIKVHHFFPYAQLCIESHCGIVTVICLHVDHISTKRVGLMLEEIDERGGNALPPVLSGDCEIIDIDLSMHAMVPGSSNSKLLPFSPDSVVTHGDFSLDNLIFDEGKLIGCIDVGRVGIADRYQDLAILWNCLGEFSPSLQKRLFQKYGIDNPDMNKLQFHLMLDEFF